MSARAVAQGALLAALAVPALSALAADADPAARAQLEQRLKLSASLMADSSTTQRILASGNPRAAKNSTIAGGKTAATSADAPIASRTGRST